MVQKSYDECKGHKSTLSSPQNQEIPTENRRRASVGPTAHPHPRTPQYDARNRSSLGSRFPQSSPLLQALTPRAILALVAFRGGSRLVIIIDKGPPLLEAPQGRKSPPLKDKDIFLESQITTLVKVEDIFLVSSRVCPQHWVQAHAGVGGCFEMTPLSLRSVDLEEGLLYRRCGS
ncbi:hypothetical protein JTE90_001593 [Oedothorax gibbosus]|uniref:Uncharacterized protein n=1 Tax=Oedothorax gibbosus TaxID=931172 RepID=A0AAV6VP59_9ARAC|nr:hypothetical protein JTE90_001593 [Oedothorax gibbosus]